MSDGFREQALRSMRMVLESAAGEHLPDLAELVEATDLVAYGPGTRFIQAGSATTSIYWIVQGIVRVERNIDGLTATVGFRHEGNFVLDLSGLGLRQVREMARFDLFPGASRLSGLSDGLAQNSFTTIEPTIMLRADSQVFEDLLHRHGAWSRAMVTLLALHHTVTHQELSLAHVGTPADSYRALLRHRPGLVRRITQRELARFLGVSEAGMSRIVRKVNLGESAADQA